MQFFKADYFAYLIVDDAAPLIMSVFFEFAFALEEKAEQLILFMY